MSPAQDGTAVHKYVATPNRPWIERDGLSFSPALAVLGLAPGRPTHATITGINAVTAYTVSLVARTDTGLQSTPVATILSNPRLTGAIGITAGDKSYCALLSGGTAACWGYNGYGQLGNGTGTSSAVAVPVAVERVCQSR